MNIKRIVLITAIVFGFYCQKVSAQEIGLSINPPLTVVDIKPDSNFDLVYKVINTSDPVNVNIFTRTAEPIDNYGNIKLSNEENENIKFSIVEEKSDKTSFLLNKNSSKEIKVNIQVAPGTPEKDYVYSIIASTVPQQSRQGTISSKLSLNIGSTLIVSVKKNISNSNVVNITDFAIIDKITLFNFPTNISLVDSEKPFRALLMVQNQGMHTIIPNISVINIDRNDKKTTYASVPQYILPGINRVIKTLEYGKIIESGDSSLLVKPKSGKGRLIATISTPDGKIMQSSIEYIALPFLLIKAATAIAAIIFILLAVFLAKKH